MTDVNTGRYYAMIDYHTVNSDKNDDDNYLPGLVATGKEGQRITLYSADGKVTNTLCLENGEAIIRNIRPGLYILDIGGATYKPNVK